MVINKYLFFNLLLLKISITLSVNKIKIFSNLKKLKFLLILKLIFKFFKEFTILIIFIKLINLNSLKNNIFLEK